MNKKSIAMTAVLAVSVLAVIAITAPSAYTGGHACGGTYTEQEIKQNIRSIELIIDNCGKNLIDKAAALTISVTIAN